MSNDLAKPCADFLRQNFSNSQSEKLKASHACELVAAFYGYKSHAALLAEKEYPLDKLEEAYIFIPDIPLIEERRSKLKGLPSDLPSSQEIAERLSAFLTSEGYCGANIWLYDTLESYVAEVLLPDCQNMIDDELSGTMAETNAAFYESPYYEDVKVQDNGEALVITASAQYKGEPLDDKPFCGDTIDMGIKITLPRIAGKRGFYDFELEVGGRVNDDWVDPEMKYGIPDVSPKDQFLEMTGGFRFGETQEQFQNRQLEIHALRNRIAESKHTVKDIERLAHLLGTNQDDEFDDLY